MSIRVPKPYTLIKVSASGVNMGLEIGELHVRRSTLVAATPARVWQEFTSFDRLAAWFSQGHRLEAFEPRAGSRIRLSVEIDGERRYFGGEVLVFDPAREISFEDNWETGGWPVPAYITIRLSPHGDGCHVELFHHGFEQFGEGAAEELEGHEIGWHMKHLEKLRRIVETN